jgi:predicted phage tail component-like protein
MVNSTLYVNDIVSPDYLVIESISNQLLPDISVKTTKVPGRVGEINQGTELGTRVIEVMVGIIGTTKANLDERERELTTWLFYSEPQKLQLPNNNKYYMAQVSDVDIENTLIFGRGKITFLCTDPVAYGDEIVIPFSPTDTNPITIVNNGNMDAFPKIELTFTDNTTEFATITNDDYFYFGQPAPVDSTTPTTQRTLVLQDKAETTTGWSSGIAVDGGTIAGTLTSDGNFISQSGNNYGSGSTWHGGALVKTLGQQIQDFTVEYYINFKMTAPTQLGRIEIYLLDINNVVIGKMAVVDSTAKSKSGRIEARLGPLSGGKFLANSEIGKEFYTFMYGRLFLQRIGQKYTFQIGKLDSNYNFFGRWSTTFYDTANAFQSKLAGIQIHIAQYGTTTVIPTMNINEIRVWNEKTLTSTEVPYIFESNSNFSDVLYLDSETGTVLKNGEPFFYGIGDLGSTFPKFQPGSNSFSITPAIANGTITYRERWLR